MVRSFEEQSQHDSLVKMMADHFESLGYSAIRADIPNYERPNKIWWVGRENEAKIPDLICYKNDINKTFIILEAETCTSFSIEHTRDQWKLFRANADKNKGEFHVVVPRYCQEKSGEEIVKDFGRELNIKVDGIWWPKT